ncbi:hypothetical protein CYY_007428 [Polysphondylium violaceum]|uniref:Uncharacterized protein n=1 Tax=Polysphondylium violaceum TaxID=133409 RepID=A0A8J4PXD3_9MYCE|nr:hypothetical protein CYY_007428 [Polysphondylium violaceum]
MSEPTNKSNKRKKQEEIVEQDETTAPIDLELIKKQFKDLVRPIKDNDDRLDFISFVCSHLNIQIDPIPDHKPKESKQENVLATIIQDIKDSLPDITTEAPNEFICIPKNNSFKGYTKENTINVDGFLYTDEDIDEMVESGKLQSHYCLDCNSKSVATLNYISHSTTPNQLKYMFSEAFLGDTTDKKLLDIGSRLGSVLYTGYLFGQCSKLTGIEINQFFVDLQKNIIKKYKMTDKIDIVHGDIMKNSDLVQQSDIIYMNNVLEFFQENKDLHIEFWKFIQKHTKKGMKLVTIPSLEESFKNNKIPLKLKGWVKKIDTDIPVPEDDPTFGDYQEIHLYTIL